MPKSNPRHARQDAAPQQGVRRLLRMPALRVAAAVAWTLLLAAFWLGARGASEGPVEFLLGTIDDVSQRAWAPVGLLALYALRPLLLVPITVINLASGFALGPGYGIALGMTGTLLSATAGYGIGRLAGSRELTDRLTERWPLVRMLRKRSFETVIAGGLMYLHADMVNLPSGLLRIRLPVFLFGIALGNSLTLTTAVLAGASVEGELADATISVEVEYLALAAALFVVSLTLAYWLRRRTRLLE